MLTWIWINKLWFISKRQYHAAVTIDGTWVCINQFAKWQKPITREQAWYGPNFEDNIRMDPWESVWEGLHPNVLTLFWGGGILGDFFFLFFWISSISYNEHGLPSGHGKTSSRVFSWYSKWTPCSSNSENHRDEIKMWAVEVGGTVGRSLGQEVLRCGCTYELPVEP